MFINCPYCRALVATDPATDLPPERCPRCAAKLRETAADVAQPDATSLDGAPSTRAETAIDSPVPQPITMPDEVPPAPSVSIAPPASDVRAPGITSTPTKPIPVPDVPVAPSVSIAPPASDDGVQVTTSTHAFAVPPSAVRPFASLLKPAAPASAATTTVATPSAAVEPAVSAIAERNAPRDVEPALPIASATIDLGPAASIQKEPAHDAAAAAAVETARMPSAADLAQPLQPVAKSAPSFARRGAATAPAMGWKLPTALTALALLLLLQLLLAERVRLAADARWRPAMSALCGALRCTLPAWREPAALALLDRDVQPHPGKPGVLRVTATFRNDARWPQPWPRLQLTLSDIDGNPVAAREFGARDYLGAAPTQAELSSGQSASIAMDIVEPAGRSVAFDFALH